MQSRDLADAAKTMVFIDRTMVLSVLKPSFWSVLERPGASWSVPGSFWDVSGAFQSDLRRHRIVTRQDRSGIRQQDRGGGRIGAVAGSDPTSERSGTGFVNIYIDIYIYRERYTYIRRYV